MPSEQREEISPEAAFKEQKAGSRVIDIRGAHELALGTVSGAEHVAPEQIADFLETLPTSSSPQALLLCCATGRRSLEWTRRLREQGYSQVKSISGGFNAWKSANLPCDDLSSASDLWTERYERHLVLSGVGLEGQKRLSKFSVLLVGAGGLGSPAALYLAAAGVGRLGIVDNDRVERSNLQRQILHSDSDVGELKTRSAASSLSSLNPEVTVEPFAERLTAENIDRIAANWDLVIDGSDNRETRYLVNRYCMANDIPLVYGAVGGFDGQVSLFHRGQSGCYECLFPTTGGEREFADCQQSGVLGVLPGLVGVLQATEAIKWALGLGTPLTGRLLLVDGLGSHFQTLALKKNPSCPACSGRG